MKRTIRKTHQPLGHLADGTPFWAYFGGDGDGGSNDGGNDDGNGDDDDGGDDGDDDSDGDGEDDNTPDEHGFTAKGRQALDRERKSAKTAREKYKPWGAIAREFGLTPEQVRERLSGKPAKPAKNGTKDDADDAPDADEIRRQATVEAHDKVNAKLIRSAVKAVAAGVLEDPGDAARYLDLSDYEVDDDGDVDEDQIKRDLRALLKDKPYLGKARKGDGRNGGSPNFDGGSRTTSTKTGMSELIRRQAGVIK